MVVLAESARQPAPAQTEGEQSVQQLMSEGLILLREAAKKIKIHKATMTRWTLDGRDGIKLQAMYIGKALYTSEPALVRFLAALNSTPPAPRPRSPTPAQLNREATAASAQVQAILGAN